MNYILNKIVSIVTIYLLVTTYKLTWIVGHWLAVIFFSLPNTLLKDETTVLETSISHLLIY